MRKIKSISTVPGAYKIFFTYKIPGQLADYSIAKMTFFQDSPEHTDQDRHCSHLGSKIYNYHRGLCWHSVTKSRVEAIKEFSLLLFYTVIY